VGTPEDIAGVVAFLASADARRVTGQVISVSGGQWMP
jgi:NAD(P)-dependent dehydrogenase (short-subunit alcohol dehydrogenase family)